MLTSNWGYLTQTKLELKCSIALLEQTEQKAKKLLTVLTDVISRTT